MRSGGERIICFADGGYADFLFRGPRHLMPFHLFLERYSGFYFEQEENLRYNHEKNLDRGGAGPWGFEPQSSAPKAERIIQATLRAR